MEQACSIPVEKLDVLPILYTLATMNTRTKGHFKIMLRQIMFKRWECFRESICESIWNSFHHQLLNSLERNCRAEQLVRQFLFLDPLFSPKPTLLSSLQTGLNPQFQELIQPKGTSEQLWISMLSSSLYFCELLYQKNQKQYCPLGKIQLRSKVLWLFKKSSNITKQYLVIPPVHHVVMVVKKFLALINVKLNWV